MTPPPAGTFIAKVRGGCIHFPAPIRTWCETEGWNLFRIVQDGCDRLRIHPIFPADDIDVTEEFCSSLEPEGRVWIPEELRRLVAMEEPSVMLRVDGRAINLYLRKVFETLGFRPV